MDANELLDASSGDWVRLLGKGDKLRGKIIALEVRDRTTPEGKQVYKQGSTTVRKVLTITFEDEAGDPKKFDANESCQRAIAAAKREAGAALTIGGEIAIVVVNPNGEMEQSDYAAQYKPPTSTSAAAANNLLDDRVAEDPFA